MLETIRPLLHMEASAAFVMLFWGNLALFVLVQFYVYVASSANLGANGSFLRRFAIARGIQAAAWASLLVFRGDGVSPLLVAGVLLAIAGLYAESDALIYVSSLESGKKRTIRAVAITLVSMGAALFGVSRAFAGTRFSGPLALVALLFLLFSCFLGPVALARPESSAIRKLVGLSALAMYLSAAGWAMGSGELFPVAAFRQSVAQDAFRIFLVILTLSGGTGVLILAKEEVDLRIVELAIRDPLTGLFNRRHFIDRGLAEFADCQRYGEEMSFIFLDLDRFKKVNDRWGHRFGDTVLMDFAALLRLGIRPLDLCCRYGGEEFVVLLPRTGRYGAETVANRLLEAVRSSKFPERLDFSYTVSAGVSHGVPQSCGEDAFLEMISRGDEALYRAKAAGRDRVVFWEDPV